MGTSCRFYLSIFVFLFAFCLIYPSLIYNVGYSMPHGLYWCKPESSVSPLQSGTVVIFTPTAHILSLYRAQSGQESPTLPWLKKVIRQEGDDLYVEGTHPRSFDSHIFGAIPRVAVQRICAPLWTWE
jgi:type IV secretory pathway protease TraF